jgi:hypothetical protein
MAPQSAPTRRISWISAPPEICTLCKEPLGSPEETSAWDGRPAHRECVRVHLIQRDPAFREPDPPEFSEESAEDLEGGGPREDDDSDPS